MKKKCGVCRGSGLGNVPPETPIHFADNCRACNGTGEVDGRPISAQFNLPVLIQGLGTVAQEVEWHVTQPSGRQIRISKPDIIKMAIEILEKVQERGL